MPNISKTAQSYSTGLLSIQAKQNFTDTDYALKLYNQTHQGQQLPPPKEPVFSDFYQPSEQQKEGELLFVGISTFALGYAAFSFL